MKKREMRTLLFMIVFGLSAAISANAGIAPVTTSSTFTFSPTPSDLWDLPHANYFTWGINFNLAPNEKITSAVLTFTNIWDWTVEKNDNLFIHLLDNPKAGVTTYTDNESGEVDAFAGQGKLVADWSDPAGGKPRNFNLVLDFGKLGLLNALNAYAATIPGSGKANFGFGLDPDCHYYNDGITFTITTETTKCPPVPEPATIAILGIGGLLLRRKR
jgi:hypothetical protein